MNFDGFSGLALAVVAGLWLLVFVPSWFKRAQDRENGFVVTRQKTARNKSKKTARPIAVNDNFNALARDYSSIVNEVIEDRGWERQQLPEPTAFNGTLEVVELAEVSSIEEARNASKRLEQHELDEILRRRRANG